MIIKITNKKVNYNNIDMMNGLTKVKRLVEFNFIHISWDNI